MKKRYLQVDTLRFIGILFIILYHFVPHVYRGGFLGVNIFLVLAGYMNGLKFSNVVQSDEPLNIVASSKHLFKKLYKPLLLVILISSSFLVLFNRDLINNWFLQVISNLFFVNNWYQISQGASYFDEIFHPSILTHLWYLSVYVQFVLLFILIQKFVRPLLKSKFNSILLYSVLTILSAVLMLIYFEPFTDPTRVYYGSDTRFFSFGIGLITSQLSLNNILEKRLVNRYINLIQIGLFALMLLMMFEMSDIGTFTYYGGMVIFDLVVAGLVVTLFMKKTVFSQLLTFKPLTYIGKHSLGIYLWYYPVYILIQRYTGPLPRWFQNLPVQILIIFILGFITEFIIKTSITQLPAFKIYKGVRIKEQFKLYLSQLNKFRKLILAIKVLLVLLTVTSFFFSSEAEELNRYQQHYSDSKNVSSKLGHLHLNGYTQEDIKHYVDNLDSDHQFYTEPLQVEELIQTTQLNITFIGDSIMLGASEGLKTIYPNSIINAEVGRQLYNSNPLIESLKESGQLNYLTVISLGSNGSFTNGQFDEFVSQFPEDIDLFFVTTHVSRPWRTSVNEMLKQKSQEYDQVNLIDWDAYYQTITEPILDTDDLHLNPTGRRHWTTYITKQLLESTQ